MFGTSSTDDLINRASRLTAEQIAELARATRQSMGSGVLAYLGLRSRPLSNSASAAISRAGREELIRASAPLVSEAVLTAAIGAAQLMGHDTSGVREAWKGYQLAVDLGDARGRRHAFRSTKKAFRKGLGSPLTRQWPMADIGVSWALTAIVTSDLVTEEGPYTFRDRELLMKPWKTAFVFPSS
jgi:hypothetical protein